MTTYIIKRIFLMIPTFFFIALLTFIVLNLAPGRPGQSQAGQSGMQQADSMEARESYRIFKEQFNFDKPVLFNTRYGLGESDVREHVSIMSRFSQPVCPKEGDRPEGCLEADARPTSAAVITAQETLEDWGEYSVPGLLALAKNSTDIYERRVAVNTLAQNARRKLINEYGRDISKEQREENSRIKVENDTTRRWVADADSKPEDIDRLVAEKWDPWFAKNKARFEYTGGDKMAIFFTDTRFAKYMGNLVRFDFGVSHVDKQPVLGTILDKLKYSISLSLISILLAYFISVPLGVWSAYRQHTPADNAVTVALFMLYSLPSFFVAVVLLELFTIGEPFSVFPTEGFGDSMTGELTAWGQLKRITWHLVLPVICLTYRSLASLSRYARTGVLDVIRADYIRTARAKGLTEGMVIVKHAVRNGMIPILTLLGSLLPALIGGSVIIEVIFNIPGMGLYLFESIKALDYNAIMAVLLISTLLTLFGLLASDLSYALVDPRISFD